jgi:hypothetical protein
MKRTRIRGLIAAFAAGVVWTLAGAHRTEAADAAPPMPMPVDRAETADARWLKKPVIESKVLDDMENPAAWSHRGQGTLSFTAERCKDGRQSIRLVSPTVIEKPNTSSGRPGGEAVLRRNVPGEDWGLYNRISFWVYPHLPKFQVISLLVKFCNDGSEKLPGSQTRGALHYVLLKPDQWNQVAWEIPHLTRDKVTAVEFVYRLQGNEPGATKSVQFDFDRLELQKVEADHWEGWNVAPGRIALSHSGYLPDGEKKAIAGDLTAASFELIDAATNKPLLTKPLQTVNTHLGRFQVLDFSEVKRPGAYFLRAGKVATRPFPIGDDVWKRSIWKTVNFFYAERCGCAVPGVHQVCHADWQCAHNGRTIVINGGWHDAGDLSQGLVNTSESAAAMLVLAERLKKSDPVLARRLNEEAKWGLAWILKTRFGDGYRVNWATMDYWTDGIIGTADDTFTKAGNAPFENFLAAATEALAARLLKDSDPPLAAACLAAARDDWRFAVEKTDKPHLELAAAGAQASIELFRATGEKAFSEKAVELADVILASQQREPMTQWSVPLSGFFYSGPDRRGILHYFHRGHEQAPVVALADLCAVLPEHPQQPQWRAAVVLHSDYLKRIAEYTAPYCMLPASVYRLDGGDAYYRQQVLQGIKLDEQHYLRLFPVWWDFRGNHGTVLSQAKALSAAARVRNDPQLAELCRKQLQWVVGRNPFAQSTMYGEGYDYGPQYSAMSGDLVGSLPVGIQTRLEKDFPFWPTSTCYNYKEVWVHPSARWLSILADLTP